MLAIAFISLSWVRVGSKEHKRLSECFFGSLSGEVDDSRGPNP